MTLCMVRSWECWNKAVVLGTNEIIYWAAQEVQGKHLQELIS